MEETTRPSASRGAAEVPHAGSWVNPAVGLLGAHEQGKAGKGVKLGMRREVAGRRNSGKSLGLWAKDPRHDLGGIRGHRGLDQEGAPGNMGR